MRRCIYLCRPRCSQRFATFHLALGHLPWLRRMLARNSFLSVQSLEISRKF